METNQFAEFVSAVVRSLPRDLNPTMAQGWIQNQGALTNALRKALAAMYHLVVDYAQSLQQMIAAGHYDWVNSDIEKNFSVQGNGRVELDAELIHFNRSIGSDEALKELDRLGYRAGTAEELLAFGAANPEKQREFPIVALGTVRRVGSDRLVLSLLFDRLSRDLFLLWFDIDWSDDFRFLAVRK